MGGAAAKAMKRAAKAQRRIEQVDFYRQRVQLQRAYAMQRAETVAAAGAEGSLGASSVQGFLSAQGSQVNAELGYGNFLWTQQSIIRKANKKAQRSTEMMGLLFGAASTASSAYSAFSKAKTPHMTSVPGLDIGAQGSIAQPQSSFFSGGGNYSFAPAGPSFSNTGQSFFSQ